MRRALQNRQAAFGLLVLAGFALMVVLGPWVVGDPTAYVGVPLQAPSGAHWFGTTGQGQDVFAQTVAGARITLVVGFVVGFSVVFIGAFIGTAAGYFGGWVDELLGL